MSTQSGISVSEELTEVFKKGDYDALIIKISPDNTKLVPSYQHVEKDLGELFKKVKDYMTKNYPNPAYIILRIKADSGIGELAFISFIPDDAHIREKMLYALTKNTLLMQLGTSNFRKSYLFAWTTLNELSYDHFRESLDYDDEAPLTSSEKVLDKINSLDITDAAEYNDHKKALPSMHESNSGNTLVFQIEPTLEKEVNSLSTKDTFKLIIFDIDVEKEHVKLKSSQENISPQHLIKTLKATNSRPSQPQYCVYLYSPKKAAFIYSCPSGSKVKDRMIYASNKQGLLNYIQAIFDSNGIFLKETMEVGDEDEIDVRKLETGEELDKKPASAEVNRLKFSKPKGPRRR